MVLRWKKINRIASRRHRLKNDRCQWAKLSNCQVRKYLKRTINNPTLEQINLCRKRIQLKRAKRAMKLHAAAAELSNL